MLKDLMAAEDWRWLRYPFLSEGDTPEKRLAVRAWLATNHYKIASVTMSFADYAYNEPYARCAAKGDRAAIAELEKRYLDGAAAVADRARAMSKTLYGKDIPYVLLMHAALKAVPGSRLRLHDAGGGAEASVLPHRPRPRPAARADHAGGRLEGQGPAGPARSGGCEGGRRNVPLSVSAPQQLPC